MTQVGRDHGGDLDRAKTLYGDGRWLDLSTGINPIPYRVPALPPSAWTALPTKTDIAALERTAARAYDTGAKIVALAGAQGAIQLVPRLAQPGRAAVVWPTYNEHAAALQAQGWQVERVDTPEAGRGADLLTVVNPNNPDGRSWDPSRLRVLAQDVGLLVVDESFVDCMPEWALAPRLTARDDNIVVMRSFGKFYGLAGVRLGFAVTGAAHAQTLRVLAGPWAVSGPAIAVGQAALADKAWRETTRARLIGDAARLDVLAAQAGWHLVGGTPLFRTYEMENAAAVQSALAQHRVWSRVFPYAPSWMRLGLPGSAADWAQVERAFSAL